MFYCLMFQLKSFLWLEIQDINIIHKGYLYACLGQTPKESQHMLVEYYLPQQPGTCLIEVRTFAPLLFNVLRSASCYKNPGQTGTTSFVCCSFSQIHISITALFFKTKQNLSREPAVDNTNRLDFFFRIDDAQPNIYSAEYKECFC